MTSIHQGTQIGFISLFNPRNSAVTSSPYWTTAKQDGHSAMAQEYAARYKTNGKEAVKTFSAKVTQSYSATQTLTKTSTHYHLSFNLHPLRKSTFHIIHHTHILICWRRWIKWREKIIVIIIGNWRGRQFVGIEFRCWRLGIFRSISRRIVRWMCRWLCCWRGRILGRLFLVGCFTFFLCLSFLIILKLESSETSFSSRFFLWSILTESFMGIIDAH